MFVVAMNPCNCGFQGHPMHQSRQVEMYCSRIPGPLLDRIDIHIEVPAVNYRELLSEEGGVSSEVIRDRVNKAREIQKSRF
jgi:magnesium chelatase family protein